MKTLLDLKIKLLNVFWKITFYAKKHLTYSSNSFECLINKIQIRILIK